MASEPDILPAESRDASSAGTASAPSPPRWRWRVALIAAAALGTAAVLPWSSPPERERIDTTRPLLSESDRQYLWDVEHAGTLLSEYGFPRLSAGLRTADAAALAELLAPDFAGRVPERPRVVRYESGGVRAERQAADDSPWQSVAAADFVQRLLRERGRFRAPPGISVSLMNLRPVERAKFDGPWEGGCRLRMYGESRDGGPGEVTLFLKFGVDRPSEESLTSGPWLNSCEVTETLVAESDRVLMRDVTADWGVDAGQFHDNWNHPPQYTLPTPGGVHVFDFNRDGVLDFLVTDLGHPLGHVLYRGLVEGGFRDVTEEVGLSVARSSLAIIADLDGDGWEDVVLGNGSVYQNLGGQRFENVLGRSNLTLVGQFLTRPANGAAVADFDRDGLLDLYLTRSSGRPDQGSWLEGSIAEDASNVLLRNLGDFQFEDVTERCAAGGGRRSTFTAVWFEANNDGWPDLYVINEFGNGVLLVNERGRTFRSHSLTDGPADFGSMGATSGDIDNDGWADLYIASMYSKSGTRVISNLPGDAYEPAIMQRLRTMVSGSQLYQNRSGLGFQRRADDFRVADVGWAYGAALADLDNDGWLDIHATAGFISRTRSKPDG